MTGPRSHDTRPGDDSMAPASEQPVAVVSRWQKVEVAYRHVEQARACQPQSEGDAA